MFSRGTTIRSLYYHSQSIYLYSFKLREKTHPKEGICLGETVSSCHSGFCLGAYGYFVLLLKKKQIPLILFIYFSWWKQDPYNNYYDHQCVNLSRISHRIQHIWIQKISQVNWLVLHILYIIDLIHKYSVLIKIWKIQTHKFVDCLNWIALLMWFVYVFLYSHD